jgi:2-aminobenzoate-CoA ligase
MTLAYPPKELWPDRLYALPELQYRERVNVCQILLDDHIAKDRGSLPAIFFNDTTISYQRLFEDVTRLASVLREEGIHPGDRILLRLLNRPHFISLWFAAMRIGAVVVATPPPIKARELKAVIESAKPALLISETELWDEVEKLAGLPLRAENIETLVDRSIEARPMRECEPTFRDTLAIIAYTSGSTGTPKGCMHSHGDLLATTDSYARHILEPTPSDRFGGHPTMAFVYGLGGLLLFPFRFGASTVLLDRFTPEALAETIRRHRVTIAFCAPTSLRMMMKSCPNLKTDAASLRYAISAGETLPAPVCTAWRETTGVEVLDGIGSTEMLHIFISSRPGRARAGSTGEVVPGYEAMVVDEKTMKPVSDGEPGLVAVRGPTGCRYLDLTDRQTQYVRDGWNLPGDIYVRDADGYFYYQCRNDDLIICGGNNVAGPEVESVLLEHPSIGEVAVVASPDGLRGMVPKAFIVLRAGFTGSDSLKEDLQRRVQSELASYKCPRKIEFVPELPKTSTGKIRRAELRQREFAGNTL